MRPPNWTEQESTIVRELRGQGKEYAEIAAQLPGRTANAVKRQYFWLMTSPEYRRAKQERQKQNRRIERQGGTRKSGPRPAYGDMPPEVFVDRAARATAPRTITEILFGDPPPSQSALARWLEART